MNYRIRKVEENQQDFERLIELLIIFANEHQMGSLSAKNMNLGKGMQWVAFNIRFGAWIAEDENGEFVGSIGVHETTPWYGDMRYLTDGWFYVLPECRSSRIGSELLETAKAFAKEKQMPLVVGLFNMEETAAKVEMMKRKGFAQVGGLFLSEG